MTDLLDHQHLTLFLMHGLRQCVWLAILAVIFLPLERLAAVHPQKIFHKTVLSDLGFYFISGIVPGILLAVPLSLAAYLAYYFVPWRIHAALAHWPLWLSALAAFVVGDFGFYWGHRWAHQIPFLWRFHSLHHSPRHVYFLISARAHPIDNVFIRLCGLVPITILGLGAPGSIRSALLPTLLMLLITVWGFFIHANIRWRFGPLEWLIATPPFHHWHHTVAEPRDRNYASMLPVWDWLFGTHYLPRKQWPSAYGTDTKLPHSVVGQLLYPLREPEEARLPEPAE